MIRFVSSSSEKIDEVRDILNEKGIRIEPVNLKIEELQTKNDEKLVRDKALRAYEIIKKPIIVEHTGLYIKNLNEFPGGLTKIIWEDLGSGGFTKLLDSIGDENRSVKAKTYLAYCDGKKIEILEGSISGTISKEPYGDGKFGWDCIFRPDNCDGKTLAQMSKDEKNKISMRRKALEKFYEYHTSESSYEIDKNLIESIKNQNVILFVGSGVSSSLSYPTFEAIIDKMADDLNYDKEVFKLMGDYQMLAEYYKIQKEGSISNIRRWLIEKQDELTENLRNSKIHEYIVELNFPLIYTTNYDNFIEKSYEMKEMEFNKIVTVSDIAENPIKRVDFNGNIIYFNIPQIVKFHGDLSNEESMVLTESSYYERLNFEKPLDIKIKSDILGKTVLFIGYSLSDVNLRYLLYNLNKIWNSSLSKKFKPKSYIFMGRPNKIQEAILKEQELKTIVSNDDNLTKGLENFLREICLGVKK